MKNGVACVPAPDILEFQICCVCTRWKYLYRSFKHSICFLSFKQAMAPPFGFFIGLCKGTSSWSKSAESRWFGVTQQQDARFAAEQFMCFQFATFCNQMICLRLAMCSWGSQGWCGWLLGISCRCLLITGHESWQSWPWMIAQYNHSISQHHLIWLCFANQHRNPWYLYLVGTIPAGRVALYGVFDGHGPAGHRCAALARGATCDMTDMTEMTFMTSHDIPWPMTSLCQAICRNASLGIQISSPVHERLLVFHVVIGSIIVGSLQVLKAAFAETQAELLRHGSSEC